LWSFHHFGSAGPLINHPSTLLIAALDKPLIISQAASLMKDYYNCPLHFDITLSHSETMAANEAQTDKTT
jgi:hypothetical protein